MKFEKSYVYKYAFKFDSGEKISVEEMTFTLDGCRAVFIIDSVNFTLHIESDWGVYGYRWGASKSETFKELLCRIGGHYLCSKLSDKTEIDWGQTKTEAITTFYKHKHTRKEKEAFLYEIEMIDHNEVRFFDFMEKYVDCVEDIYIAKDFPRKVKVLVKVFETYLKPQLKKELEEANNEKL